MVIKAVTKNKANPNLVRYNLGLPNQTKDASVTRYFFTLTKNNGTFNGTQVLNFKDVKLEK